MSSANDKYRNPDAPPGYRNEDRQKVKPLAQVEHNPDAPPGMYKFESDPNNNKIYFPQYDLIIDLDVLAAADSDANLDKFIIQTSEEESDSSLEAVMVKEKEEKTEETKSNDKDNSVKDEKKQELKIKSESLPIEEPEHLFGSYHCAVCAIKLNSEKTYEAHISGKRHLKNLKAQNVADTVIKSIPQRIADKSTRYPPVPSGVKRVHMKEEAIIQDIVVKRLVTPCPGLHNVIEIQGLTDTTYYCKLCDSPCSANTIIPHLGGYKHQLKCLKYFDPKLAEEFSYKHKFQIEGKVIDVLRAIQRKEGMGSIVVEKEFYEKDDFYAGRSRRVDLNMPSTSFAHHSATVYDDRSILDETKSGFYCRVCESHMNSEHMWESHIRGKRHAANLKKAPGSMPSKLKSIPIPNAISHLEEKIKHIKPIVGLDQIRETQNRETNSKMYQCLLCNSCHTSFDIEEHLVTLKHKRKYLQHIDHPELMVLDTLNLNEHTAYALIDDLCLQLEKSKGRGHPQVFLTKDSV